MAVLVRARLIEDSGVSPTECMLPKGVVLVIDNPMAEALYVRCAPEGRSTPCEHIDIRPHRVKEISSAEEPQRVFLPEGLVGRGIRLVVDAVAAAQHGVQTIAV